MFSFSDGPLDGESLKAELANHGAGACATFEGWVRDHNEGKAVRKLAYEAYVELAVKEGERIVDDARTRFGLLEAQCVHRVGDLALGDMAVWVGVSAPHRGEAFAACKYIIDEVKHRVPIWKKEFYTDGDSGWVNCERCAAHGHEHADAPAVSPGELYARQMRLPQVGEAGQRRLAEARVLVVGSGGLGCPAAAYLACAGVGTLGICEADRVEASNLHRQPLFHFEDVGKPKARVAAQRLNAMNPLIDVRCHECRLTAANVEELFAGYDLVLDCTDNFESKYLINDAAVLKGKRLIAASIYQFEGHLFGYDPAGDSPCLRCIWPEMPEPGCIGSCAEVGVLGAVPGIAGAWQAMEALKVLLGLPGALRNELMLCDFLSGSQERLHIARDPACRACGAGPVVRLGEEGEGLEVEPGVVLTSGNRFLVIDIREESEIEQAPITIVDARPIPGSGWRLDAPPIHSDQDVVLCCARGVRSKGLAHALRQRGYDRVYSLRGGAAALR